MSGCMSTVLLNMHACEFLQVTEDKSDQSSPEGDSDTEELSIVAGILYYSLNSSTVILLN